MLDDWRGRKIIPHDIFKLGQYSPIVQQAVDTYLCGQCTWEQAMMTAVAYLATDLMEVQQKLFMARKREQPAPVPMAVNEK